MTKFVELSKTTMISVTILFLSITIMSTNASGIKRIVYENAGIVELRKYDQKYTFCSGVESGRTIFNMCFLSQLNSSSAFTGFKPVLGR